ncbi:MAG: low molecular weight phosphatase family protein [bacterium]
MLFVCKGNMFRSVMAEAIYRKITGSRGVISAGTYVGAPDEPEGRILSDLYAEDSKFFKIMDEHGINIRDKRTKRLTPKMVNDADIVVSMAQEPFIPDFLKNNKKVIWWQIADPDSHTIDFLEETYRKLETLITELVKKNNQTS